MNGREVVHAAVQRTLDDLVEDLGLAARPVVAVEREAGAPRVLVDGVALDVTATLADPTLFRGTVGLPWYRRTGDAGAMLAEQLGPDAIDGFAALAGAFVADVVRRGAARLASPAQLAALLGPRVPAGAVEGMALALRLGLSVRGAAQHCRGLADDDGRADDELVAEQVVAALAPPQWDILVEPGYLDDLVAATEHVDMDAFAELRRTLFTLLGVRLPRLHLVPDAALPPHGFAFDVNGVRTPTFIGLPPDASLVVGSSHDPDPDVVDPLSGLPAALVHTGAADLDGYAIGPVSLMAHALHRVAADRFPSTVGLGTTRSELDLLELVAPKLTDAIRPDLVALTRRRRELLATGTSIRDLRTIAQTMLDEAVRAATR